MYYKKGTISNRPPIPVSNPTEADYRGHGWIPYIRELPNFDPNEQKAIQGDVTIQDGQAVQQYETVDLTGEEKAERREGVRTEAWRLREILEEDGLLQGVNGAVLNKSGRAKQAWNEAPYINRTSKSLESIRQGLGLTHEQVDDMFKRANDIEI